MRLDDSRRRRLHPPPSPPSRATRQVQRDVLAGSGSITPERPPTDVHGSMSPWVKFGRGIPEADIEVHHLIIGTSTPRRSRSAMVVGVGKQAAARDPKRLTTRCAGTGSGSGALGARFMATHHSAGPRPQMGDGAMARDPPRRDEATSWTSRSKSPLPGRAVACLVRGHVGSAGSGSFSLEPPGLIVGADARTSAKLASTRCTRSP